MVDSVEVSMTWAEIQDNNHNHVTLSRHCAVHNPSAKLRASENGGDL